LSDKFCHSKNAGIAGIRTGMLNSKKIYTLLAMSMQFSRSFDSIQAVCAVWLSTERGERYGLVSNNIIKSTALKITYTMASTLDRNDVSISANTLQLLLDDIILRGKELYTHCHEELYTHCCVYRNVELHGKNMLIYSIMMYS